MPKWLNSAKNRKLDASYNFKKIHRDDQLVEATSLLLQNRKEKEKKTLTQSTMLSSKKGRALSTGRRPVINSKSTTPKENTSDFSVSFPLEAYSGAKYLQSENRMYERKLHKMINS